MTSKNLLQAVLLGLLMALIFGSCKKDIETSVSQTGDDSAKIDNGFARYAWTGKEADFFDLGTYKRIQSPWPVANRNNEPASLVYHPALVGLYNEIAAQNQAHQFVGDIVANAGLPIWRYAQVIEAGDGQSSILIVPLAFDFFPAVTSLITATKSQGGYTINAVSRKELLDTEHGNPRRKLPYAKALAFYDKLLFGTEGDASTAFCEYVRTIEENPQLGPVPPLPPDGDCEWRIVEVCSDLDAQVSWFNWPGSVSVLPPHLDHDGDGIINDQDQDWHELMIRLEIGQEDFTDFVMEWWEDHYEQEYGDYEDYWENWASNYNGGGQDFHEFWDDISGMWDDFWDWASNLEPYDDLYFNPGYDPYENCPWDPFSGGAVEEREIRCEWYFILDCGEAFNASNWYQVLTHAPCPQCPEFGSYDDLFSGRVKAYYDTHEQAFLPFTSLDGLVQTAELIGCDAFSPGFEQCLNEALLASAFGLSYTNSFTEEAINWLVNTPVYPEGPGRVYTIATYWNSQGNSAEARERIERVVNWIGSVEGLDVDNGQLTWLLSLDDAALTEILNVSYALLEEKAFDEASYQAVELGLLLHQNGAYSAPFSSASLDVIGQYFGNCCAQYSAINSGLWMQMFQAEERLLVQAEGYTTAHARMEAIYTSITQGWSAIQHLSVELDQLFAAEGISFPQTQEEWEALAYIMWEFLQQEAPQLLLECSPIVGDFLSFKNAFVELKDGNYLSGSVEFAAGLLGIFGPGKVFKFLGKATKVAKWGFKALKLFQNVNKFFKGIFTLLVDKISNLGWSVRLEEAANKVKVVDGFGDEVVEIQDDVMDIRRADGFFFIDIGDFRNLSSITPTSTGYINSTLIGENASKLRISAPGSMKTKVDEILATSDSGLAGLKGEELSELLFNRNGYSSPPFEVSLPSQIPGGNANGFDNVFIKYGPNGEVDDIIINEVKVGSGSGVQLNPANMGSTPPLPQQMSDGWILHVLGRMNGQGGDLQSLAGLISNNLNKLTKTVTFIKKPSGEINIIKLDNF
ncbi:MAG: hypothetical protein KDD02_11990 [Phaeodactylibacter sp.]|nr:hypothetical protein [Phaeodactylibacter sp.]